jgi:hypothetical protein
MEYAATQQNSVRWSHPMVHDDDEEAPHINISPPEEEEEVAANDSDILTITNVADTKNAVENSLLNDGIHVVKTSETAATVIQTHFRERFARRHFFSNTISNARKNSHDDVEESTTNTVESASQQQNDEEDDDDDDQDDEEEEPPKDWSGLITCAFLALFTLGMIIAKPLVGCCGKSMGDDKQGDDKQDAAGDLTNPDQLIQNMGAEGGGGGGPA